MHQQPSPPAWNMSIQQVCVADMSPVVTLSREGEAGPEEWGQGGRALLACSLPISPVSMVT